MSPFQRRLSPILVAFESISTNCTHQQVPAGHGTVVFPFPPCIELNM